MTETKKIIGQAPCFPVADVEKSASYYRDKLGYSYDRIWGDPGSFCMPKRDGHTIMLAQVEEPSDVRSNTTVVTSRHTHEGEQGEHVDYAPWDAYVWCNDAESLFREFKLNGATIHYEPTIQEYYGMKEFAVKDLDGYVIAFGQSWPAT